MSTTAVRLRTTAAPVRPRMRRRRPAWVLGAALALLVTAACADEDPVPPPAAAEEDPPAAEPDPTPSDPAGEEAAPEGGPAQEGGAEPADEPGADDPADGTDSGSAPYIAVFVDGREFHIEPHSCMYFEGEVTLAGLGTEVGSDVPVYLNGFTMLAEDGDVADFWLDIGTDNPFERTEDSILMGTVIGGDWELIMEGNGYIATTAGWHEADGDLGEAVIEFACV